MVTCTIGALRASAGLLCGGCDPNYAGNIDDNNKLIINLNDCLSLSNQCFNFLLSMNST